MLLDVFQVTIMVCILNVIMYNKWPFVIHEKGKNFNPIRFILTAEEADSILMYGTVFLDYALVLHTP